MEEMDENMTPFWLQTTDNRRGRRRRHQPSSLFFNTGVLIILLLVIAFAFVFVIIPPFQSFTSKIFKPHLVKKSWDSVNLVLVLFAVICGFLSKSDSDNDTRSSYDHVRRSNQSTPRQWYDDSSSSDQAAYNSVRRLRSFSSYPDLRQESSWMMNDDDRWRFYDDTHLYNYRSRSRRELDQEQVYTNNIKDIAVDTVHTSLPPAPPSPPTASPPQPPMVVRRKPKRTNEDLKPKEKSERKEVIYSELKIKHSPPPPPTARPPPPPPPPPLITGSERRSNNSEKKRGGVTKEFLSSLRRKKKKQRQRSVENLEEFFNLSTLPLYPPSLTQPPPPPPPPPLPSFYHNIFSSKKSKARKNHSVPPPPPPPSWEWRASKREPQKPQVTTQKPPLPVKISNINNVEGSVESGSESPLHAIPPPPPPPPFKMQPWKFEVHGDFVRLKSINSSRSGSPDLDDPLSCEESPSENNNTGEINSGELGLSFCPSPDVNTKADNFIARFRAGLKLEKINSVKGRSNLGPDPGPSTV